VGALRVETAPELFRDALADLLVAAPAIDALRDEIQQLRQLDDLAVCAPDDERRLFVPRPLELPDELDPAREPGWRALERRLVRFRTRGLDGFEDLRLLLRLGGGDRVPPRDGALRAAGAARTPRNR
jgi:hypothetical protein